MSVPLPKHGNRRRTRTKVVPLLPTNRHGKVAKPVCLEDPQLTIDTVDDFKRSDCRYYVGCLDHSAKSGWEQFSCLECGIYERNPDIDLEFEEIVRRMDRIEPTD